MKQTQLTHQLRTDSFYNVIVATTVLTIGLNLGGQLFARSSASKSELLWIGLQIVAPILVGYWAWQLTRKDRRDVAVPIFFGVHLLLIAANIYWSNVSPIPYIYFFGYFIVISSTLISPAASFGMWGMSVILLLGANYLRPAPMDIQTYLTPLILNLFLSIGSFITTIDWQAAVESTSLLHIRAQQRRDELFSTQTELKRAINRQKSLNTQLITSVEVGQRIATQLDLDTLLDQVVNLTVAQFNFAYVGVFLLEGRAFLTVRAQAGDKSVISGRNTRVFLSEENLLSQTAAQRQSLVMADIQKSQFPPHPYFSSRAQSEIGLPLIVANHLHGVLNIQSYVVNAFTEENMPMLQLLANQIAIALQNAQLFQAAVLARKEAEKANEIKSRFLASMSHELRTPLNAILNFTGFVTDGVFGPLNREQADTLEKALDSGTHLLSLINDILDLAKIEAGSMDMFIQEVDMNNLLKSTSSIAKGLLKNKPVKLVLDIDEELPHLFADKRRIRQVLLNLISNAVKFTREGSITIAAHQVDGMIQISVQDTGIGIPPEDQELVFESFHQVENEFFSETGTGLGLPIAKHFVEAHGGRMWLESTVGVGTTFFVALPLQSTHSKLSVDLTQTANE